MLKLLITYIILSICTFIYGSTEIKNDKDHLLSLNDAIAYAIKENLLFLNNFDQIEIDQRRFKSSRFSLYDPQMQFSYNKQTLSAPPVLTVPFDSSNKSNAFSVDYMQNLQNGIKTEVIYETNFTKVQNPLFKKENNSGVTINLSKAINGQSDYFLKQKKSIDSLSIEQKKSYLSYMNEYQKLVLNVIKYYLDTVKNKKNIEIVKSALKYRKELLSLTKAKFELGVATQLDILRIEVQVASQEEEIIEAENTYKNSFENLLNLLNYQQNIKQTYVDYNTNPVFKKYDPKLLVEQALIKRFDIRIEQLELDQQVLELNLREKLLKDKINLTTQFQKHGIGTNYQNLNDLDNKSWSIGFSYNMVLGNRAKKEDFNIQKVLVRTKQRKLLDLKNNITLKINTIVRSILSNQKRIGVLSKTLLQAKENVNLAKASFEKGIKTSIDVLDAQDDLLKVNNHYLNAQIDLTILEMELEIEVSNFKIPSFIKDRAKKWVEKTI